jgi:hypothetical protein
MQIVEERLYLTSGNEDVDYYHEGIEEYAIEAFKQNLRGSSYPPLFDNILIDYQDLIMENSMDYVLSNFSLSLDEESPEYVEGFREDVEEILLGESFNFLEEFCRENSLTTLKKVYDERTYQVKFITEINSPQIMLITEEEY